MRTESRDIIVNGEKIGELSLPIGTSEEVWKEKLESYQPPRELSEEELFRERMRQRYLKRSQVKDALIADMATTNIERVFSGVWTVSQLRDLTQDPEVKLIIDDVNSLSFELAIEKINSIGNHLITREVKDQWIELIQTHLYL